VSTVHSLTYTISYFLHLDLISHKNEHGIRGGVELAFMSTTTNREVAISYSKPGRENKCSMVFEIQMGMIDRGAEMSWVSQYPTEEEILFQPLTGVEVFDEPRVEQTASGRVIFVPLRLSCNQSNQATVEEVIGKQKKSHLQSIDDLIREFQAHQVPESCLADMLQNKENKLHTEPLWFNDADNFLESTKALIDLQKGVYSTAVTKPEAWCEEGHEATGLSCALIFGQHLKQRGLTSKRLQLLQGIEGLLQNIGGKMESIELSLRAEHLGAIADALSANEGLKPFLERAFEGYRASFEYHQRAVELWEQVAEPMGFKILEEQAKVEEEATKLRKNSKMAGTVEPPNSRAVRGGGFLERVTLTRAPTALDAGALNSVASESARESSRQNALLKYVQLKIGKAQCFLSDAASVCASKAKEKDMPVEGYFQIATDMLEKAIENLKGDFHRGEEVGCSAILCSYIDTRCVDVAYSRRVYLAFGDVGLCLSYFLHASSSHSSSHSSSRSSHSSFTRESSTTAGVTSTRACIAAPKALTSNTARPGRSMGNTGRRHCRASTRHWWSLKKCKSSACIRGMGVHCSTSVWFIRTEGSMTSSCSIALPL
jgi:hypothetical protein